MALPKILIVDDEEHIIHVLSMKLRSAGYEALVAADGEQGFEIARRELPALVVTDLKMPVMTGLELGRALKACPETSAIPVLILTARGHAIDRDALRETNVCAVVAKPFSPRSMLQRIHKLLRSEQAEAA